MSSSGGSSSRESSSSESSSSSSSLATTSDRGSHGEIAGQPPGGEVSQYYYKLLDPSRLDDEASVSGSFKVDFCSRGIPCRLSVSDLERIRERYQFPDDFSLVVPSGDAHR